MGVQRDGQKEGGRNFSGLTFDLYFILYNNIARIIYE